MRLRSGRKSLSAWGRRPARPAYGARRCSTGHLNVCGGRGAAGAAGALGAAWARRGDGRGDSERHRPATGGVALPREGLPIQALVDNAPACHAPGGQFNVYGAVLTPAGSRAGGLGVLARLALEDRHGVSTGVELTAGAHCHGGPLASSEALPGSCAAGARGGGAHGWAQRQGWTCGSCQAKPAPTPARGHGALLGTAAPAGGARGRAAAKPSAGSAGPGEPCRGAASTRTGAPGWAHGALPGAGASGRPRRS